MERAATALPDVAAPVLSQPDSGLRRRPYRSRLVDVAEEVEQQWVLGGSEPGAWPHAAAASGRIADLDAAGSAALVARTRGGLAAASSKMS